MTAPFVLCALSDLPDPGAKGPFSIIRDGEPASVFVTRCGGVIRAWIDQCPHVGVPLEMEPDKFLDLSGSEILCSLHGARFHPETGLCVLGPCKGRSLTRLSVTILNGMVTTDTPTPEL